MSTQAIALWIIALCMISLLPFTARLGKLYARYLYSKYFYREDIYVHYKHNGRVVRTLLVRKLADGTIVQKEVAAGDQL